MSTKTHCRLVEARDVPAVAKLLSEVFNRSEPLALAAGQSLRDTHRLASVFGAKGARERLAVAAFDADDDSLVGAAIAHDFGTPVPAPLDDLGAESLPIIALIDTLEASYRRTRAIEHGAYAHVFMIGVAAQMSGRGVAGQLVESVLANARKRGYRFALTEATSVGSQRVFRRAGFRELDAASYAEFEFNGDRPFAGIEAPRGALLMEREL